MHAPLVDRTLIRRLCPGSAASALAVASAHRREVRVPFAMRGASPMAVEPSPGDLLPIHGRTPAASRSARWPIVADKVPVTAPGAGAWRVLRAET